MTTIITACIADDEPPARRALEWLLARHPDITLVGSCGDGESARRLIADHTPDVVFLDVQMPGSDGFAVLERLPKVPPAVVFVTAFDHYAVRAFEQQAVDYLVKPFSDARFDQVLDRVRDRLRARDYDALTARLEGALAALSRPPLQPAPLVVRDGARTYVLPPSEIECLEAEDYYVRIHAGARQPLVRRSLQSLLAALEPYGVMRVHRSAAVNLAAVRSLRPMPSGDAVATLATGREIRVSRSHRGAIEARLAGRPSSR